MAPRGKIILWEWQENNSEWKAYPWTLTFAIQDCNVGQQIRFNSRKWKYRILKTSKCSGIQQNLQTKKRRRIQLKYTIRKTSNQRFLATLSSRFKERITKRPSWWSSSSSSRSSSSSSSSSSTSLAQNKMLLPVVLDSNIAADIILDKLAHCTDFQVSQIYSVQNEYLWTMYQSHRKALRKRLGEDNLNEEYLFHGTKQKTANIISVQGYFRDFNVNARYGVGVYFSNSAKSAISYSTADSDGYQYVFLSRVIVGEYCKGSESYQRPPCKPGSLVPYESMVNDTIKPTIFVICNDHQAYPEYLVKLKKMKTKETFEMCECGGVLRKCHFSNVYESGNVVCDGCNRKCLNTVYHCLYGRNTKHPQGFDLCEQCITR